MLDFFIDSIFALFGGWVFQQTIGIPMCTNCAPLLSGLFLHAYEVDFLQGLQNLIQPTISLEMPVPSQGHYGFHSFPVVDRFCLFI